MTGSRRIGTSVKPTETITGYFTNLSWIFGFRLTQSNATTLLTEPLGRWSKLKLKIDPFSLL